VNLAQRDQRRCSVSADCLGQQTAICNHGLALVLSREAEIQFARSIVGAVGAAQPAPARAESMPEPASLLPPRRRKPLNTVWSYLRLWRGA